MDRVAPPDLRAALQQTSPERPRPLRRRPGALTLGAVAVITTLALAFWRFPDDGPPPLTRGEVDHAVAVAIERAAEEQRNAPPDGATVYRTIFPSLVTVATRGSVTEAALGTGVVVNEHGQILTALHVVGDGGGGPVEVLFADGTQASGRIAAQQDTTDIAVLSVDRLPEVVVPAVLGGGVQVGEPVYPVGNPLGLRGSLTAGVVSATGRSIRIDTGRSLSDLIQFDAAVNPGNSGGPLLDRDGQVVGIVTALANPSEQPFFVGIGFAVPIATAGRVAGSPQQ